MIKTMTALMLLTSVSLGAMTADEIWRYLENDNDSFALDALKATTELSNEEALPFLLYAVELQRPKVAKRAGELLAERRIPEVFDELLSMLDTEDEGTYKAVSTALMAYPPDGYFDDVKPLLKNDSSGKRLFAVRYVGEYGGKKKVELLKDALSDPEESVKHAAVVALKNEDVDIVPAALELFGSETTQVVVDAVEAISDKKDPRAFEPLVGLLNHKFTNVKEPAAEALSKYEGDEYVDKFIELAGDENRNIRAYAVGRLAASGEDRAIAIVVESLNDKYIGVVLTAINGLTRIGYREIGDKFKDILVDVDYADEIRFAAMRGLAEMGIEGSGPIIADVMNDPGEMSILRKNAAVALSFFHNDFAFEVLRNDVATKDVDSPTIEASIKSLGLMGDARAVPLLEDLVGEPGEPSQFYAPAVVAIGMIGGPDAYEFLYKEYGANDITEPPYDSVLPYALAICGDVRGPRLITEELTRIYEEDKSVGTDADKTVAFRRMAITGLGESGFEEAKGVVVSALNDPEESVVMAALKAAGSLFGPDMIQDLETNEKLNRGKVKFYTERTVERIKERYGISDE